MSAYKMESLSQKCKNVMFENINLDKTNNLPKEGLAERTLLLTVNELKEKNEKEYEIYLKKINNIIDRYDNQWRKAIFWFEKRKKNDKTNLKRLDYDNIIQQAMINREINEKIYLKKNNYDMKKSFYDLFHEMNSYLNFKLSRKYQDFDFVNRVCDKKNHHYLMHFFITFIYTKFSFIFEKRN